MQAVSEATREYVRQARRLRARLSDRPGELHSRIAALSAGSVDARGGVGGGVGGGPVGVGGESGWRLEGRPGGWTRRVEAVVRDAGVVREADRVRVRPRLEGTPEPGIRPETGTRPGSETHSVPATRPVPGTRPVSGTRPVLGAAPEVVNEFAGLVERAIESGLLRQTVRGRLIRRAGKLGISRFDANLIIASVLHACGNEAPAGGPANAGAEPKPSKSPPDRRTRADRLPGGAPADGSSTVVASVERAVPAADGPPSRPPAAESGSSGLPVAALALTFVCSLTAIALATAWLVAG